MVSRSSFSEICPRNTEVDDRIWEVVPEHDHQGDNKLIATDIKRKG